MIKPPKISPIVTAPNSREGRAMGLDPGSKAVSAMGELAAAALRLELRGDAARAKGMWEATAVLAEEEGMSQPVFDAQVAFARRVLGMALSP